MRVAMICLVSYTVLASTGCGKKETEAPPVPVKVGTVAVQDVRATWRYSGAVQPDVEVKLAFKQTGYVASLHQVREGRGRTRDVQVGDRVPAGTVLARLRPAEFVASLNSATGQATASLGQLGMSYADLSQAKADQVKADQQFERAQGLYATKAMTRPDYDNAVAQHAEATAKVESSQRQVESRKGELQSSDAKVATETISLNETNLATTMPSLIVAKDVQPGTLVSNGTTAFTIADTRTVKVEFGVPDSVLPQFRMGAAVPVTIDGLQGQVLTGYVSQISSSADSDSRVFEIKVSLPNKDAALKPGMIAEVRIEQSTASRKLPVLPVAALITSQSGSSSYAVFVVDDEKGKQVAHLRSVRVGQIIDRSAVIDEGLQPGDRIILERTNQLADGSVVRELN
jgi:RND family efflux transporter MFP subunit